MSKKSCNFAAAKKYEHKMRWRWTYITLLWMAFFVCSCAPEKDTRKIVWLSYHENSSAAYPLVHYDLEMDKDSTFTLVNSTGRSPEEALKAVVPSEVADSLAVIVEKYGMLQYRDDYRPLMEVVDGTIWQLTIQYDDETAFASTGYAARPSGDGLQRLQEYLGSIWAEVEGNAKTVNLYK
jgi:hypothetical protein